MTRFKDLRYITPSGSAAPINGSHPDNPLSGKTALARVASDARNRKIRWEFSGRMVEFSPKYGWAALDPTSDLFVIVVGSGDLPLPDNGMVINPDGTINHQILAKKYVEICGDNLQETYDVERMSDIYIDENDRLVIGLDFHHEWVERRYYDPSTRQWGGRVLIYRR